MLPEIKKKITSFLTNEDGKITKQSVMVIGSIVGSAILGALLAENARAVAVHSNSIQLLYVANSGSLTSTHQHHTTHAAHGTHVSYSDHSSHSTHSHGGGIGHCSCTYPFGGR